MTVSQHCCWNAAILWTKNVHRILRMLKLERNLRVLKHLNCNRCCALGKAIERVVVLDQSNVFVTTQSLFARQTLTLLKAYAVTSPPQLRDTIRGCQPLNHPNV